MTDLEELVEKEVEELSGREDVRAVAVVGSYARGEDEHNDIDFFIIVDGDWRRREGEMVDDILVERFYNSLEGAKNYLDGDSWYTSYHWYRNAEPRYDPESLFEELADLAEEKRNEKMSVNEEELLYTIWDKKQDLDTRDVGQKRYLMNEFFNYLLFQHYLLKGEVPVKTNYRVKKLKEFDGYMYKLSQDFLTSSSTGDKERTLEKMIDHVTRNIGDPGPEWETEKEYMGD
ncbi:MAG: nucleotidyltransferase domain-containing protein [Candidatus Nanohaloarchaea archaeon]